MPSTTKQAGSVPVRHRQSQAQASLPVAAATHFLQWLWPGHSSDKKLGNPKAAENAGPVSYAVSSRIRYYPASALMTSPLQHETRVLDSLLQLENREDIKLSRWGKDVLEWYVTLPEVQGFGVQVLA